MKYSAPLLAIAFALISFNGCGSTSDSTPTTSSSSESSGSSSSEFSTNLGQSLNSEGYYGGNVYFSGKKIVGEWETDAGASGKILYSFNSDGNGEVQTLNNIIYTGSYGVSEDGNELIINMNDYVSLEYVQEDENNSDCIIVNYGVCREICTDIYLQMCKLNK